MAGLNQLYYGDNLDVLRKHVASESVDLLYLDPPFNANRDFNVIFGRHEVMPGAAAAQIQAFSDTWSWTPVTDQQYTAYTSGDLPLVAADALISFRTLLGENDATAYLVNMAPRLVEMHRVLKRSGTLALHCDATMSHYLKALLDAIFGAANFRNEISWQRTSAKGLSTRRLPNNHDIILLYGKSEDAVWYEDAFFLPYDPDDLDDKTEDKYSAVDSEGRRYQLTSLINPNADRPNLTYEFLGVTRVWRWTKERMQEAYERGEVVQTAPGRVPRYKRYLDQQRGKPLGDVWTDIPPINARAAERLGYPTQKPLALLERLLRLTTKPGDVVLDPFCGCGTTIDAAQRMDRQWMGVDITYLAIDLIAKRLLHTYGDDIVESYRINGIPRDLHGAYALFSKSPFDFERWAVSLVHAQPNEKQVGDKGIDGVARFPTNRRGGTGHILVSVKGGKNINPAFVRDLLGTVETQKAQMGILITMSEPTRGVIDAVNHGGTYTLDVNGQQFPRIQTITVAELLSGKRPNMPNTFLPYIQAQARATKVETEAMF